LRLTLAAAEPPRLQARLIFPAETPDCCGRNADFP
jgi:hypothetical protein